MKLLCRLLLMAVLALTMQSAVRGQELDENLALLAPVLGTWVGHFDDAEEASYVLNMTMEPILEGKAVRLEFSTTGMTRENVYYWNPETNEVNFVGLTSYGHMATGVVSGRGNLIVNKYKQINPDGSSRESEGTWELGDNGNLIAKDGHTIIYEPQSSQKQ